MESETAMKPVGLGGQAVLQAQSRVVALLREDELLGLAVETVAEGKSSKFDAQPLRYQPGGERLLEPPRCYGLHWERIVNGQAQQLRQTPRGRTHLHPQLQRGARLLPKVAANASPALQIVEQGFDPPAAWDTSAYGGFGSWIRSRRQATAAARSRCLSFSSKNWHPIRPCTGVALRKRASATTERSRIRLPLAVECQSQIR